MGRKVFIRFSLFFYTFNLYSIVEYRFINFMKTYENDKMDFAYSAERSIQDGLQDISEAEVSTVLISYAVMFLYITIALGRIRSVRYLMVYNI